MARGSWLVPLWRTPPAKGLGAETGADDINHRKLQLATYISRYLLCMHWLNFIKKRHIQPSLLSSHQVERGPLFLLAGVNQNAISSVIPLLYSYSSFWPGFPRNLPKTPSRRLPIEQR